MQTKKRFIREILFLNPLLALFYLVSGFLLLLGIREVMVTWNQNLFFRKIEFYQSGYLVSFNNDFNGLLNEEINEKKLDTSTMEIKEIFQIKKEIERDFFAKFESELIDYQGRLIDDQNENIKIWTYDSDYCSIDNFSKIYLSKIKGKVFSDDNFEVIMIGKTNYETGDLISYRSNDGIVYQIPIIGSISKNQFIESLNNSQPEMFILNPQCDLVKKNSLENMPSSYILYSDSLVSMQNDLNKYGKYLNVTSIVKEKEKNQKEKKIGFGLIVFGLFFWSSTIFMDQKIQYEKNYFYYLGFCNDKKKELTTNAFFWLIIKKNIPIFFLLIAIFIGVMISVLNILLFLEISFLILVGSYFLLTVIFFHFLIEA